MYDSFNYWNLNHIVNNDDLYYNITSFGNNDNYNVKILDLEIPKSVYKRHVWKELFTKYCTFCEK